MSDPVRDAWAASGSPVPVPPSGAGQCARCGTDGPALPWRDVLSANFGDWDRMGWRHSGVICPACAWAFACKPLRTHPHLIAAGTCERLSPPRLRAVLSVPAGRGALVAVPVAGKKHIIPWAPYGVVVTDHEQIPWTAGDAARLAVLAVLRERGFGEAALAEPAPRHAIARRLGAAQRADVMAAWPLLACWRQRPSYLAVACRATRKEKADG